ncbi:MAG: putative bifunctional diguanylate cyclase/phosphodiesterase [Solirubrobacterales bacterium]
MSKSGLSRSPAWVFLGFAGLVWAAAIALWLAGGAASPGTPATTALLASAFLATIGLVFVPGAPPHASGQGRTAVDGLIVAGSTLFIAWMLGLGELYDSSAAQDRALFLALGVANLTLAAAATVMLTRARPAARIRLGLVTGALAALAVASGAMSYLALDGSLEAATVFYLGWPVGWLLLALAARRDRDAAPLEEVEPGLPTRASVFVPSVPFGVAVLGAAVAGARGDFHGTLVWIGAAVIVLIIMRQVLALVENISFWRNLEAKVEARTDELRASERRFRSLVQNSSDVILVLGDQGQIKYLSPSARSVLGHDDDEIQAEIEDPIDFVVEEDLPRLLAAGRELRAKSGATRSIEFRVLRKDGLRRDVEAIVTNLLHDPAVAGFVVNARDISERKELERQLTHRAFHDPLTELANRALFGDRLEHALSRRGRATDTLAVLFLDLDNFKNVNDSLGHESGDRLLGAVSQQLLGCARPGDTVARLGGDEFALLLEDVEGGIGSARVAARVLRAFEEPLNVDDRELFVQASIGIATNSEASATAESLLRNADVAMYAAKARGKGRFEHFEHSMHAALVERLELEHDLREALERPEFRLHYQPIVSLETGAIPAVEALVRWQHPERGLIAPGYFIGLAEQTGLIVPIGRWVLEEACRQAAAWRREVETARSLTMMVNLSVKQLEDPGLLRDVEAALESSGLDPDGLLLEITESVIVEDEAAIETMKEIRALGIRMGIDDFGTKYSSLSYLRRLPLDVLKIDREFIGDITSGSPESALIQAIVAMSHSMGLTPIAEGVERPHQEEELRRIGCNLAQGYLFAKPAPPQQVGELIADSAAGELLQATDRAD